MLLVGVAWIYVVLMVAVVEGTSAQGTLLGAFFTLLLYGVLPLAIVGYLFMSPARKRARRAAESAASTASTASPASAASLAGIDPDGGTHAAGDAVAPEGEKP